jgi:hypothetical protein
VTKSHCMHQSHIGRRAETQRPPKQTPSRFRTAQGSPATKRSVIHRLTTAHSHTQRDYATLKSGRVSLPKQADANGVRRRGKPHRHTHPNPWPADRRPPKRPSVCRSHTLPPQGKQSWSALPAAEAAGNKIDTDGHARRRTHGADKRSLADAM